MRIFPKLTIIGALICLVGGSACVRAATIDLTTKGNWVGTYGSQGYILNAFDAGSTGTYDMGTAPLAADLSSLPNYVSGYSYTGASDYVWDAGTANVLNPDSRYVESPDGSTNKAATTFSYTNFTVNLNLKQPKTFQLAVYGFDFEKGGRSGTITVGSDVATLTEPDYAGGAWAVFDVTAPAGPLAINIVYTNLANPDENATISAIAFDVPEPASFALLAIGIFGLIARHRRAS